MSADDEMLALEEERDAGFLSVEDYWATFGDDMSAPDYHPGWCHIERKAAEAPDPRWRRLLYPEGSPLWRHAVRFHDWHLWKAHPRRLLSPWQRMRRGWSDSDAWSLDHHLASIMAQAGRRYIAIGHFEIHCRPGFTEWVEGMEHYAAGCWCRKSRAAVRALPKVFGSLWL